jgi:hypothetical protein
LCDYCHCSDLPKSWQSRSLLRVVFFKASCRQQSLAVRLELRNRDGSKLCEFIIIHIHLLAYQADLIAAAATYATQCYSNTSGATLSCGIFVKNRLATTADFNAPCTFHRDICRQNDSNLLLDTGFLDSNKDFGVNMPDNSRFLYQRLLHCAPLRTEGYRSVFNLTSDRSYTQYFYGTNGRQNFTYEYSNDAIYESKSLHFSSATADYEIG